MWLLFAVTVFVAPAVTLVVVDSGIVYERYLLVAAAFMILSLAWPVARAARTSMAVAAALVVLFLLGNVVRTWQFIERGRGSFITATRYMTEHSTRNPITVGSDHDFRNGRVLGFYLPFVPGTDALSYYPQEGWPAGGPEWLLVHRLEAEFAPRAELTVRGGYKYTLAQSYPYAGLSGWHLALYHNARDAR